MAFKGKPKLTRDARLLALIGEPVTPAMVRCLARIDYSNDLRHPATAELAERLWALKGGALGSGLSAMPAIYSEYADQIAFTNSGRNRHALVDVCRQRVKLLREVA
jgi:hypothetical protein